MLDNAAHPIDWQGGLALADGLGYNPNRQEVAWST
jgi:hypothetical protein